jgi:hypothetical protein
VIAPKLTCVGDSETLSGWLDNRIPVNYWWELAVQLYLVYEAASTCALDSKFELPGCLAMILQDSQGPLLARLWTMYNESLFVGAVI